MPTQATNTTPNYHLSQWEENDRILREDFNADNAAIDAALAAHDAAIAEKADTVALTAAEEKIALVCLFDTTLTASAASVVMDLSGVDMSRYTKLELHVSGIGKSGGTLGSPGYIVLLMNGDSDANYSDYGTGASTDTSKTYMLCAYAPVSALGQFCTELCSTGGHVVGVSNGLSSDSSTIGLAASNNRTAWRGGTIASLTSLTLQQISKGSLLKGARITLYGYRV